MARLERPRSMTHIDLTAMDPLADLSKKGREEISFRERLGYVLVKTKVGRVLDAFQLFLSLASVILYVFSTYQTEQPSWFFAMDVTLAVIFMIDYLTHVYIANNRKQYMLELITIVDLASWLPSLITLAVTGSTNNLGFLRVVRVFRMYRIFDFAGDLGIGSGSQAHIKLQMLKLILTIICVVFCATGIIQTVENSLGRGDDGRLTFLDSLYFLVVTVTTVGYGDITPETELGKVITMVFICFFFVVIPQQTSELWQLSTTDTAFRKAYTPQPGTQHVLVCGDITYSTAYRFLREFYHEDHGAETEETEVVFLAPVEPNASLRRLLLDSRYGRRVSYIIGSALLRKDLESVDAANASGCFLLSDRHASSIKQEDAATMFRAMAFKNVCKAPVHGLLLGSRKTMHQILEHVDHLLCVQEAKLAIMAHSVTCHGFTTLIANLLRTAEADNFADDVFNGASATDVLSASTVFDDHLDALNAAKERPTWLREYEDGAGNELYITNLPRQLAGIMFHDLLELAYHYFDIIIIGVESDFRRPNQRKSRIVSSTAHVTGATTRHVVLNPIGWRLKPFDTLYVICADDVAAQQLHSITEEMISSFGLDRRGAGARAVLKRITQSQDDSSSSEMMHSEEPQRGAAASAAMDTEEDVQRMLDAPKSHRPSISRSMSVNPTGMKRSSKGSPKVNSSRRSMLAKEEEEDTSSRRKSSLTYAAEIAEAISFKQQLGHATRVISLPRARSLVRDATLTIVSAPSPLINQEEMSDLDMVDVMVEESVDGELDGMGLQQTPEDEDEEERLRELSLNKGSFARAAQHAAGGGTSRAHLLAIEDYEDDVDDLLQNHVLVFGSVEDLVHLIRPLRADYLDEYLPVVVLHDEPPTEAQWEDICRFPGVYYVRGSPLVRSDLYRVRITQCSHVIVLSNPKNRSMTEPQLQDWDSIVVSRDIEELSGGRIFVITDMIHNSNMQFMKNSTDDEYYNTPSFACGRGFSSSSLSAVLVQSYFNKYLINILSLLIGTEDTLEQSYMNSMLGRGTAVGFNVENTQMNVVRAQSHVFQVDIPREFFGRYYMDLFMHMCTLQPPCVPLALYRVGSSRRKGPAEEDEDDEETPGARAASAFGAKTQDIGHNPYPYVYTKPRKRIVVAPGDKLIVLARRKPELEELRPPTRGRGGTTLDRVQLSRRDTGGSVQTTKEKKGGSNTGRGKKRGSRSTSDAEMIELESLRGSRSIGASMSEAEKEKEQKSPLLQEEASGGNKGRVPRVMMRNDAGVAVAELDRALSSENDSQGAGEEEEEEEGAGQRDSTR